MGDNEVFSSAEEERDPTTGAHQERIEKAFGSLQVSVNDKISKKDEERVLGIREAVTKGDRQQAEQHLTAVRQESSWLYEELMKHPEISVILRELSIMGF